MAPCVAFGSQRVTADSRTPYTDATQTKKNKPNYVKRPMNAFMVWSQMRRKAALGSSHHAEISKKLGQEWKTLSEDEKKPFYEEASHLRKLHNIEFPTYKYQPKKKADPLIRATPSGRVTKKTKVCHRSTNLSEMKLRVNVDVELAGLSNPTANAHNPAPVPGYMPESPESLCSSAGVKQSPTWSDESSASPCLASCGGTTSKDDHTQEFNTLFDFMENGSMDRNASGTPEFKVVQQKLFDPNNSYHTPPSSPNTSVGGNAICHASSPPNQVHCILNQNSRGHQQPILPTAVTNTSTFVSTQNSELFNQSSHNAHLRGAYQNTEQAIDNFEIIDCNVKTEPGTLVEEVNTGLSVPHMSSIGLMSNLSRNQMLNATPPQTVKRNDSVLGSSSVQTSMAFTIIRNQTPFSPSCSVPNNSQIQYPTFGCTKVDPDSPVLSLQNSGNHFSNIKVDIGASSCDSSSSALFPNMNEVPMQIPSTLPCDVFGAGSLNESFVSNIDLPTPDLDFSSCPDIPTAPLLSVSDVDECLGDMLDSSPIFSRFYDSAFIEQCSDMSSRDPVLGSVAYCAMQL